MSDNKFKLQINFTKAYVGDDGGHYLEGIASGPEVDLTGERMSIDALKSMVTSLQKRLVEFRDAHKDEWNDDLGEVVSLTLDENNHLHYKAKLDLRLSKAQDLWYLMTEKGKKYGVSIGGSVIKAGMEYVADLGRQVYTYFDVDLYEISVTRQAAYQYSFANAVLRSLPKGTTMSDKTQAVEKTEEVPAEEVVETPEVQDTPESQDPVAAEEQSDATNQDAPAEEVEVETAPEEEAATDVDAESPEEVETKAEAEEETEEEAEAPVVDVPAEEESEDGQEVTKALTEAQAEVATLTKSLTDTQAEVAELTKSLTAKTDEAEAALTELVEVKKSLAEKEAELEKRNARKAIVFDKFNNITDQVEKSDEELKAQAEGNRLFANFVITGAK